MAIVMVVVGVLVALHAVLRGIAPFGMDRFRFLAVPLVAITLFVVPLLVWDQKVLGRIHPVLVQY